MKVASTHSQIPIELRHFQKSGLFDILIPAYKKATRYGVFVKIVAGAPARPYTLPKRLCRFTVRPRSTQRLKILVEGDEVPYLSYIMNR